MFVDELTLHLRAGRGGNGVVRWRHEKGIAKGGPSGGNGGRGGDVYALAVPDVGILARYRHEKEFRAGDGEPGMANLKRGGEGKDLILELPVGARLTNSESGYVIELDKLGQKELLLDGGRGGLGNDHFKSSINTTPKKATPGEDGDEADFYIELLLFADAGLIGLPNAGKSTLLNSLTEAKSKIGAFPFTTLEPSLGSFYEFILADIPGLIEGASEGKGLGHKFLRHVERTRSLVHCVSAEEADPIEAYKIVRKELEDYNKEMMTKDEIIVLTKVDLVSPDIQESHLSQLKTLGVPVFTVSVLDDDLVKNFSDNLAQRLRV